MTFPWKCVDILLSATMFVLIVSISHRVRDLGSHINFEIIGANILDRITMEALAKVGP